MVYQHYKLYVVLPCKSNQNQNVNSNPASFRKINCWNKLKRFKSFFGQLFTVVKKLDSRTNECLIWNPVKNITHAHKKTNEFEAFQSINTLKYACKYEN